MTFSEENYLKIIYHLSHEENMEVTTNAIAEAMQTKASSVTDMLKKLHEKGWVEHKRYQGVSLTEKGKKNALFVIRKHRLWEVFLAEKLHFSWEEIHEIAEQLEHIQSDKLIEKLDKFLLYPEKDPHGDPIPDKFGNVPQFKSELLSLLKKGESGHCVGVKNTSREFLQYLNKIEISIGKEINVLDIQPFDNSLEIQLDGKIFNISSIIAENIYVKKNK
ncbi:metal-dependent transcriptional regulator [Capnocytophaga sp. oral taxon 338]|jgi:Mn-dependent transcriptional regulator|uniref:metal-dependent transcriptional regulator n=1 Tax=Capnocytophaga sp. oral taxon 338 TaxID=710239 RepID=UPI000202CBD8|nr:metal-dependent transcriptional regulator [Capnocytophaga sp. oral taxon 338]EGD34472.1 iron-dependent repressor [Capnocytophaga sp. oral taxon 338 str. F0234]